MSLTSRTLTAALAIAVAVANANKANLQVLLRLSLLPPRTGPLHLS